MYLCDVNPRKSLPLTNSGSNPSPFFPNFDGCFAVFAEELCTIMHNREVVILVVHGVDDFLWHLIWIIKDFLSV